MGFTSDLRTILAAGTKDGHPSDPTLSHSQTAGESESWAILGSPGVTTTVAKEAVPVQTPTALPDISTIERPEELTRRPPYWLFIRRESKDRVVIEGSHGPTLELIEKYMKKWCRGNTQSVDRVSSLDFPSFSSLMAVFILLRSNNLQPPLVKIHLQESMFGMGLLHDSVIMETARSFDNINVSLLLVLAESVLGYMPVGDGSNIGEWQFKKTTAFK